MKLGIFAKTFVRPDTDACLSAVAAAGLDATQFNLSVVGLPTIPDQPVPVETLGEIRSAATRTGVELSALSGTFNAAHPDPAVRARPVPGFGLLCAAAGELGIPVITLSSGSRHPQDMWSWHPDNTTPQAWADSRATLQTLCEIAEPTGVRLAFEPEHSNVVATAAQAVRMIAEVGSPLLGVVYDAANLLDPDAYDAAVAEQAIRADLDALAPHLLLAHAKELTAGRAPVPAGAGLLPWPLIVDRLDAVGFTGAVIIHGLDEADVPQAVATLRAAGVG